MTEALAPSRPRRRTGRRRRLFALLFSLTFFVIGVSWSLSAPAGSSPDEDYHLASIWCPPGVPSGECNPAESHGRLYVNVPITVIQSTCYAHRPEMSAECTRGLDDSVPTRTYRVDNGSYPFGYYQFAHIFVTDDVNVTVLLVRAFNVALASMLTFILLLALPDELLGPMLLAQVGAWTPAGLSYIASVNPSSWSIIGAFALAVSLVGLVRSSGRHQRQALVATAVLGALMSVTSRSDAAFFAALIPIAVAILLNKTFLADRVAVLVSGGVSILGAAAFVFGGQKAPSVSAVATAAESAGAAARVAGSEPSGPIRLMLETVLQYPSYFTGFFGIEFGRLGWVDTTLRPLGRYGMICFLGALIFLGARRIAWGKIIATGMLLSVTVLVPAYYMAGKGLVNNGFYQPRYMLPLLAVMIFFWLSDAGADHPLLTTGQAVLVLIFPWLVNASALHTVIRRYTTGLDVPGLNLDRGIEWRWGVGSPMLVWGVGVLAYAIAILLLAHRVAGRRQDGVESAR